MGQCKFFIPSVYFFLAVAEKNEMTQCECWELQKASYWICVHNTHPSSAVGTAVLQAKQKKTAKQFSTAINPFAEYLTIHRFPMCKLDVAFKGLWFVISDLWHCLFMILTVCCHLRPWNFLFFWYICLSGRLGDSGSGLQRGYLCVVCVS